jgi:hypothetical protein
LHLFVKIMRISKRSSPSSYCCRFLYHFASVCFNEALQKTELNLLNPAAVFFIILHLFLSKKHYRKRSSPSSILLPFFLSFCICLFQWNTTENGAPLPQYCCRFLYHLQLFV